MVRGWGESLPLLGWVRGGERCSSLRQGGGAARRRLPVEAALRAFTAATSMETAAFWTGESLFDIFYAA